MLDAKIEKFDFIVTIIKGKSKQYTLPSLENI